jgi:DNA-binding transcriptional ArsR family regulator
MGSWSFLTNHARALLCIAADPGARLRDIAGTVGITERRVHGIVTDLVDAGYVVKDRDGRRNQYRIRTDLPLRDPTNRQRTIGELLDLLVGGDEPGEGSAEKTGADEQGRDPASINPTARTTSHAERLEAATGGGGPERRPAGAP